MPDPIHPAKINVGQQGPAAWLQAGLKYGVNDSGPFQSYSYRGTRAEVEAMAQQFNVAGWTWTVTREEAGLATLDAAAGYNSGPNYEQEVPENIWELNPNEVEKELTDADFPFASTFPGEVKIERISASNRALIKKYLADNTGYDETKFTGDSAASSFEMFLLMKAGVTSFPVEASLIRHTQIVSNRYTVQASFNNCGRILSRSSMLSIESVPTDLLYALPTTPDVDQFISTVGDLQYGWRKVRPDVTRMSRFKWRLTQNYQFGLWAIRLYGAVL